MISRICVGIIITVFLLAPATINMVVIPAFSSQLTAKDFEEVRDNLVELYTIEDRIRKINLKCVHVNELVPTLH